MVKHEAPLGLPNTTMKQEYTWQSHGMSEQTRTDYVLGGCPEYLLAFEYHLTSLFHA